MRNTKGDVTQMNISRGKNISAFKQKFFAFPQP